MRHDLHNRSGFYNKTAAMTMLLLFVLPSITAMETDPSARVTLNDGGETIIVFEKATRSQFDAVVDLIRSEGGVPYSMNPPNAIRSDLPAGLGSRVLSMHGVHTVSTEALDVKDLSDLNAETRLAVGAWNLNVKERDRGYSEDHSHHHLEDPVTTISDRSAGKETKHAPMHGGIADIKNDAIVCNDELACTSDLGVARRYVNDMRAQARPLGPMAPAPGPQDTSEYMMGSMGVAIVLPESNGSIDSNSEDWTGGEQTNVINEINNAFTWWINRINAQGLTVSMSFSYTTYLSQPTSYEPITRNGYTGAANQNMWLWMNEIQGDLGFANGAGGGRAFANYTRAQHNADWGFVIWVADSSNDGNNQFADNTFGFAALGGPYIVMTYGNNGYGIGSMDAVTSHEMGHTFYALDEYSGPADSDDRSGYLNCINGNAIDVGSPPPMSNVGCIMRGGSSPYSNNQVCSFTRGQIGWNDTDADNIPDTLDTFPKSTIDAMPNGLLNTTTYTYYGNSTVVALNNNNAWGWGNDVTLNTISLVQWRLDAGSWTAATPLDGAWSNVTEAWKLDLAGLSEGWHTVEVRTRNDQNNWENPAVNDTFFTDLTPPMTQVEALPQYISATSFPVNWTGSDGGSGLHNVRLFYTKDNGPWTQYLAQFSSSPITFIHMGDGYYEFYTIGKDNASNYEAPPGTRDAFTTVEETPPNSTLLQLPEFTNQTAFDIEYTAEDQGVGLDDVEIFFRKDNGGWSSLGSISSSPYNFVSSGDGLYDFYIIAKDILGNTETKPQLPEASITVDTVPPMVTPHLVGVKGDSGWFTTGVLVTFSTSEPAGHLDTIHYRMNNGTWEEYDDTFTVPGDGEFDVEFYGVDKAQNHGSSDHEYLRIDTTPPEGALMINGGNNSANDPTVDVAITYSENASVVTDMMISEDPSFSDATWRTPVNQMTYDLTSHAGIKTLYAKFKNSAGLGSEPVSATIIIDPAGPTVKITKPEDGDMLAVYSFTVEGTANDNVDIDLVELSIDGGTVWELVNGTQDWDAVVTVPTDGDYTITARTFDLVGNMAEDSINITVDARLPEVDITTPKQNSVSESKTIPVEGRTDPNALVKVNGAAVPVDENGNFSTVVSLRDGTNEVVVTIQKPAGTITKKIRVIYVHPPIIITDLKHFPPEPTREDNVTITCVVPGNHIQTVELKWKLFGTAEETLVMERGEDDLYTARIGPFKDGGNIEYYVVAEDDIGERARYPEKGKREFFIPRPEIGPEPEPEPEESEYGWFGWIFLLILFAIVAVAIGMSMRQPKPPPGVGPRRVSDKTMSERIDPDRDDDEGSRYRDRRPRSRLSESDKYDIGNGGSTRFREDDF